MEDNSIREYLAWLASAPPILRAKEETNWRLAKIGDQGEGFDEDRAHEQ